MSVNLVLVPGTPATPSHRRATNVPSIESYSSSGWYQIDDYDDWFQFVAIENEGAGRVHFIEGDVGGQLKLVSSGAADVNYWNDAYAGWAYVSSAGGVATVAGWYFRPGGVWTASGTIASPAGANNYLGSVTASFDTDVNGAYKRINYKLWNITNTEQEMRNEIWSAVPRKWTGLTFWDHGLIPAAFNVDRSGTGGDATLDGTPASSGDSPGISWLPLKTYSYGY